MSLLAKLKAGTRNTKTIKFPGTEEKIVLRILSEAERQEALLVAEQHFKAKKVEINLATSDIFEAENTLQLLYRAISDPDGNPIIKTVDEFRSNITRDEKDLLTEAYLDFEQESSPSPARMSAEKFESLLSDLKKNPEIIIGSVSSLGIARRLITSLVNQLSRLQTANGSTSTQ